MNRFLTLKVGQLLDILAPWQYQDVLSRTDTIAEFYYHKYRVLFKVVQIYQMLCFVLSYQIVLQLSYHQRFKKPTQFSK